jgi:hypothetical protein
MGGCIRFRILDGISALAVVGLVLGWWRDRESIKGKLAESNSVVYSLVRSHKRIESMIDEDFPNWREENHVWDVPAVEEYHQLLK